MKQFYAGIGSRETPEFIKTQMRALAIRLAQFNLCLRSGGADGADSAFEAGAKIGGNMEIFLARHQAHISARKRAEQSVIDHHPAPDLLSGYSRELMIRNYYQIMGDQSEVNPSLFVLCWTPDGTESVTTRNTGGTGQAIRIAVHHRIPVFNMKKVDAILRLREFLKERGFPVKEPATK